jgi:hypothetical protein
MNQILIALSWCVLAQAPGDAGQFEPIRVPAGQAAPPADLSTPAEEAAPAAADPLPADAVQAAPAAAPPAAEPPAEAPAAQEPPADNLETLENRPRQRLRPPELIAEALENPTAEALSGTPLALAQAMARAPDRPQQLRIAHAYWRLAAAQAGYHWAVQQRELLSQLTHSHAELPGALSAAAAAEADVSEAALAVEQAQQELRNLAGLPDQQAAPLATDRPHVGDYRMDFERYFAAAAPPRIRLIHRTLPVRRKTIDAHAEAIVAALDAVQAAGEPFAASGQGLSTLLGSLELLKHQRRAFIADVLDYNLDIADYAFAVDPPSLRGNTLVSMLIYTAPRSGPTPARPGAADPSIQKTFRKPSPKQGASAADADDWGANYAGDLDPPAADDPAVYQGLLAVAHQPLRVQKLANLLHWDRNLSADAGEPAMLSDCLRDAPPQNRRATIDVFWRARESAARLQLLNDEQERLDALQSIAIPQRDQRGMAEAGVRLQAARRAARADILDARLDLLAAQYELTLAAGRPLEGAWLLPASAPQSGRYLASARGGSAAGADRADRMAHQYETLRHRAEAVIQCDAHRAELVQLARENDTAQGADDGQATPLDRVVWAISRQKEQTLAFLHDLTEYNRAIADYVLATQPPNLSAHDLAGKLAIERSTLRDLAANR